MTRECRIGQVRRERGRVEINVVKGMRYDTIPSRGRLVQPRAVCLSKDARTNDPSRLPRARVVDAVAAGGAAARGTRSTRVDASDAGACGRAELTEEGWQTLPPTGGFIQREPNEGGAPSQRTEFRVAYDATTLYVRVRAFDAEPDKIVTYLTRRDDNSPGDWLRVFIDSYHDRRTAYEFGVNPSGVKQDRYWFNDTNRDDSWDAVWDVQRLARRATAGGRVPHPVLAAALQPVDRPPRSASRWSREIGRLNETSTWPLLSRSANGFVSSFGELGGLSMSASPKRLELVPYMVVRPHAAADRRQPAGRSVGARRRRSGST